MVILFHIILSNIKFSNRSIRFIDEIQTDITTLTGLVWFGFYGISTIVDKPSKQKSCFYIYIKYMICNDASSISL